MNMGGTYQPQPTGDVGTMTSSWPQGAQHPAGVGAQRPYLAPSPSRYRWADTPWLWSRFCPCCSGWCCTTGKKKTLGLEGDGNGPSGGIYRLPSSGVFVSGGMWRRIGVLTQCVFGEISMLSPRFFAPITWWEQGGSLGQTTRAQPLAEPPPKHGTCARGVPEWDYL